MKRKNVLVSTLSMLALGLVIFSCTEKASTRPNFIFKPAPKMGLGAKVGKTEILEKDIYKGIESEIYDAEMKLYDLKMGKLRAIIIEKIMSLDPKKKGLTNDQYLEKYITNSIKITDDQINKFAKERKIPKEHINTQMMNRIRQYLSGMEKKKAIDTWLARKTKGNAVEVYLKKPERPVFKVDVGESLYAGAADAKVTVIEFTDFQCPFCSKASMTMRKLKKKYGNKIKVVMKHFPLPFHKNAKDASEAMLCMSEQSKDKAWKMYGAMFDQQDKLTYSDLQEVAKKNGADTKKFDECMKSDRFVKSIDADIEQGSKLGINSTPTFFVNGKMVSGALPVSVFSELIEEELAK